MPGVSWKLPAGQITVANVLAIFHFPSPVENVQATLLLQVPVLTQDYEDDEEWTVVAEYATNR